MIEQGLREAIIDYQDDNGLISPHRHVERPMPWLNSSGNGLLYLSLYYLCLAERNELDPGEDIRDFLTVLRSCRVNREPGLMKRAPYHPDQEGPDDYIAVAAAAAVLGWPKTPHEILTYGRTVSVKLWGPLRLRYFYSNIAPGQLRHRDGRINWSAWLGRMPQVICHFQFAAGELAWLRRPFWAIAIVRSAFASRLDQDAWLLSALLIQAYRWNSFTCSWAVKFWMRRFRREWPDGLKGLVGRVLHPDHPIARYWPSSRIE